MKTTIWTRPSGSLLNPNPSLGAQLLQADLKQIGIDAEIKIIEWGELIRRAKAGEHDLLFMGWAGDNGDPDNFLTPQFSCAAVTSGTNFARYCDKTLDKLIADGKSVSDQTERSKLYHQAQQQIQQQALWIPSPTRRLQHWYARTSLAIRSARSAGRISTRCRSSKSPD